MRRCRLILTPEGLKKYCVNPEIFNWNTHYMNMGSLQSVSLNLPRYAYMADIKYGNQESLKIDNFYLILQEYMKHAKEILLLKYKIITNNLKNNILPMCNSIVGHDKVMDLQKMALNIGYNGLNECVATLCGKELHECESARKLGGEILTAIVKNANEFTVENKIKFNIWEQPSESTAEHLAKLDLKYYPEYAKKYIYNLKNPYYTNSGHIRYSADVALHDRLTWQGNYHKIVQGGVISHVWLNDHWCDREQIWNFIKRIAETTNNIYFCITKEHTSCNKCFHFAAGIQSTCPKCNSQEVEHWSRITGYYSRVKQWNNGKKQEFEDRVRY